MTDWVAQDDWSQINLRDRVRVTRDDGMITGEVASIGMNGHGRIVISPLATYGTIEINLRDWQLSVPAKPAVELPTEPGSVIMWSEDYDIAVAHIDKSGDWILAGAIYAEKHIRDEIGSADFTVYAPVAVTAMKVLEDVSKFAWADGFMPQLRELSNKYGVTDE